MFSKTCIIIVGPTAAGKTDVSLQLAKHFNTAVLSADSRQCFKELNIGVAKPDTAQLAMIPHYFINSHSIHEEVNVEIFEQYALQAIHEIFIKHDIAIVVGGTGLYINAFCHGIDKIPATDKNIRQSLRQAYLQNGLMWLQQQVKENDYSYFQKGEINNPQRMLRALEVKLSTGKSILEFQTRPAIKRNFNIVKFGIQIPKEILHERIHLRVDKMIEQGLEEEAKNLIPYKNLNALQTVGYREFFDYFENKISFQKTIELIKLNTRHYAKRQLTWFKKDTDIIWLPAEELVTTVINDYRIF